MDKTEDAYKWLDKMYDIQLKYFPESEELNFSGVMQKNKEDAMTMARYLYEDLLEYPGIHKEYLESVGRILERFTVDDKHKVMGFTMHLFETCGEVCPIEMIVDTAIQWDLEDKIDILMDALFYIL